ncbi:MAG: haloacid dehalogenase-like hydrolase [Caldilineaceae bacterium]|nr:haloacid dehalogenase-like hydrolase [Caldilineaceae bacterium]
MSEHLSSWRNGAAKQAILDFVASVVNPDLPTFVPLADRIATLDNDGCCWCEKPTYAQFYFAIARLKQMATDDPSLLKKPEYKAAYDDDMAYFVKLDPHMGGNVDLLKSIVFETHTGMSDDEFCKMAHDFLTTAKHPRYHVLFHEMYYQPMAELIRYLQANGFKVFICSAGGITFIRSVAEDIYNIAKERVIGTNIGFETKMTDDGPVVMRTEDFLSPIDDGPGKPVNIQAHVGRKPIFAGGNSDGDLHMLWLAETNSHPSFSMLVHHDDEEREYAYDIGSEKTLRMAPEHGWTVVSMKEDWARIFPWE